ncbi:MAG: DUF2017 family protein [Planctomycetota bacterium]
MAIAHLIGGHPEEQRLWLRLVPVELELLRSLPTRLRDILLNPERAPAVLDRLFPPTHTDDAESEAEHRRLLGQTLLECRLDTIKGFEQTLARVRRRIAFPEIQLSLPEVDLWLHVINDVRLLLGTQLDIKDNDWRRQPLAADADVESYCVLVALSTLQEVMLGAMGG